MRIFIPSRHTPLEQFWNLAWKNVTTLFQLNFQVVPMSCACWIIHLSHADTEVIMQFKSLFYYIIVLITHTEHEIIHIFVYFILKYISTHQILDIDLNMFLYLFVLSKKLVGYVRYNWQLSSTNITIQQLWIEVVILQRTTMEYVLWFTLDLYLYHSTGYIIEEHQLLFLVL